MTRDELRELVRDWWGPGLRRPDLAQMRRDVLKLQAVAHPPAGDGVYVIDDAPPDYDRAMREFFGAALEDRTGETFVDLWLTAVELWLAVMAEYDGSARG